MHEGEFCLAILSLLVLVCFSVTLGGPLKNRNLRVKS